MIPLADDPAFRDESSILPDLETLTDTLFSETNSDVFVKTNSYVLEFSGGKYYYVSNDGNVFKTENLEKDPIRDCRFDRPESVLINVGDEDKYEETFIVNPNDVYNCAPKDCTPPVAYTPDDDHCYSKVDIPKKVQGSPEPEDVSLISEDEPEDAALVSEDEVDVITVSAEYNPPALRKSGSQKNAKSQKCSKKKRAYSSKNLKTAGKRTCVASPRKASKRRKVNNNVGFSSIQFSDAEDDDKRANHNTSERRRREAQRDALQGLRRCIPELVNNPKAAKVTILQTATRCIQTIKLERQAIKIEKQSTIARNKYLKDRYRELVGELPPSLQNRFLKM